MSMSVATASLIGAGLSFGGGLFSNRTNKQIARENLAYQREANEKNMQLTKEANEANIQLQRDINNQNIAFQQQENDITRMREDNAVQRAAADMTAAGLSKTLAAGNPAPAQGLTAPQAESPQVQRAQVQALNNQFRYESALQKMNIAQLMQDMTVKDEQLRQSRELNNAQIDYIKAQTLGQNNVNETFRENFRNEQLLKLSQISVHNSQVAVNRAQEKLASIEGDYRAEKLQNEIDHQIASINLFRSQNRLVGENITLTQKEISYYANQIAESIARTNKLSKESELVVQDLAYKKLEYSVLEYNLGMSKEFGVRTTDQQSKFLGINLNSVSDSFGDHIKDNLLKVWNNVTHPIWDWQF